MIKDVRWSGWVCMGECFFWYRPTRVVPDQRPLNGCVCKFFFNFPVNSIAEIASLGMKTHISHVFIMSTCRDMRISLFYEYYGGHLGFLQNITCYTCKKKWNPIFFLSLSYSEQESVAKSILTSKKSESCFYHKWAYTNASAAGRSRATWPGSWSDSAAFCWLSSYALKFNRKMETRVT